MDNRTAVQKSSPPNSLNIPRPLNNPPRPSPPRCMILSMSSSSSSVRILLNMFISILHTRASSPRNRPDLCRVLCRLHPRSFPHPPPPQQPNPREQKQPPSPHSSCGPAPARGSWVWIANRSARYRHQKLLHPPWREWRSWRAVLPPWRAGSCSACPPRRCLDRDLMGTRSKCLSKNLRGM